MSSIPERHSQGPWTSTGAATATCRDATTAPRRDLRWPAVPTVLRDLGLTSNQVWGLTKTDQEWSEKLETALTAARRNDLKHGTNAAYVHGCVCHECREHQRIRMGRKSARSRKAVVSDCG
jgi:hypothetical protein